MSSTPWPYISISTHYCFWLLMKLNQESGDSRSQWILWFSKQKLWMLYRLFSTKIFIADGLASHSWIYSQVRITQTQNEFMHRDSELKPDVSVATGTATTTATQVTASQSTDCWFMSCQSKIVSATNLISQHMTCRFEHKQYTLNCSLFLFIILLLQSNVHGDANIAFWGFFY